MSLFRLTSLLMITVFAAGCDSDSISGPPTGLPHAAAMLDCVGPLGEVGVKIYLAPSAVKSPNPPPPHVRIAILESVDRLTQGSRSVAGGGVHAVYNSNLTVLDIATSGHVSITAVAPDTTIEGSVDLIFPIAGRVHGEFTAAWIPRGFLGCL